MKLHSDNEAYKTMKAKLFSSFGENLADTARANITPTLPYGIQYSSPKSPVNYSPVSLRS